LVALLLLACTGCGKGDQAPGQPAQESKFEGSLDVADAESISGWAWDSNLPWPASKVDIYDGETLLATVPANKFREDLLKEGIGSGQHSFVYATPAELKDGKAHTIRVTISGTDEELTGSPMTFPSNSKPAAKQEVPYEEVVKRIQEVVPTKLPRDATVLVVSKGDDDLLKLEGLKGWHFPQDEQGNYAGHNPGDSKEAIDHLKKLRDKGAEFLLLPEPYFWWLKEYKEFKRYLDDHCAPVYDDQYCIIYRLSGPGEKKP
jgi:hypothetical protein